MPCKAHCFCECSAVEASELYFWVVLVACTLQAFTNRLLPYKCQSAIKHSQVCTLKCIYMKHKRKLNQLSYTASLNKTLDEMTNWFSNISQKLSWLFSLNWVVWGGLATLIPFDWWVGVVKMGVDGIVDMLIFPRSMVWFCSSFF